MEVPPIATCCGATRSQAPVIGLYDLHRAYLFDSGYAGWTPTLLDRGVSSTWHEHYNRRGAFCMPEAPQNVAATLPRAGPTQIPIHPGALSDQHAICSFYDLSLDDSAVKYRQ